MRKSFFRRRYLDLAMNPETRCFSARKISFGKPSRNFLTGRKLSRSADPVLEHVPGGAEAEPFVTSQRA